MRSLRLLTRAPRFLFAKVSSDALKALRDATGAPLMKCKEALDKFSDMDQAKAYLREKNLIFADKKEKNDSFQGVLSFRATPDRLLVTTFNSETDFVAKNSDFLDFVRRSSDTLAQHSDGLPPGDTDPADRLQSIRCGDGTLLENQKLITARIQEKIKISKLTSIPLPKGAVWGVYQHKEIQPGVSPGLSYVILKAEGAGKPELLKKLADDLAVLVFCKGCRFLELEDLPQGEVEEARRKIELDDAALLAKKPADVRAQIVHGKMMRLFEDDLLMEQTVDFAEGEVKVRDFIKAAAKEAGAQVTVAALGTVRVGQ